MVDEPRTELPPELRAFIHSCIDSLEQVELLMLLRGSARVRTAREIASELHLAPSAARRQLEALAARGLMDVRVAEETGYRLREEPP
jgi:predicted ArsR family transcriptional regulator